MKINQSITYQEIEGFGGAFTDSSTHVFDSMPSNLQDQLVEMYFGETGLISQAERNATISVLEEAKLLKLSKESLEELTEEYPALFEDLKLSAADRTG